MSWNGERWPSSTRLSRRGTDAPAATATGCMTLPFRSLLSALLLLLMAGCNHEQSGDTQPGRAVSGPGGADLHRYLEQAVEEGFSGAYLVVRGGDVLFRGGYGAADRENGVPYTYETVFDVGSITKQFTAAAILTLEEEGRLHTTDPISRFFEDVPEDKQAITLHHLLTHGSGLVRDIGWDYSVMMRDSLVRSALDSPLEWVPGTQYAYSNAGYSLLGVIVEIASERPYEEYANERLFQPAGMRQTGYTIPDWSSAVLAVGYEDGVRWGTPLDQNWAEDGPWWSLRANGGMLSTLGDLYRWHQALQGDAVLSVEAKEKLFASHIALNPEGTRHYGYGWMISTAPDGSRLVEHNGGNPYFFADFRHYVDHDLVILMATNAGLEDAVRVHRGALALMF